MYIPFKTCINCNDLSDIVLFIESRDIVRPEEVQTMKVLDDFLLHCDFELKL